MSKETHTDYETFMQIRAEILCPIADSGLDVVTLRSLHESKLVYLNQLRVQCFHSLNTPAPKDLYSMSDYQLIMQAIHSTKKQLRELMLGAISSALNMI